MPQSVGEGGGWSGSENGKEKGRGGAANQDSQGSLNANLDLYGSPRPSQLNGSESWCKRSGVRIKRAEDIRAILLLGAKGKRIMSEREDVRLTHCRTGARQPRRTCGST